jgi:hypothetical protein
MMGITKPEASGLPTSRRDFGPELQGFAGAGETLIREGNNRNGGQEVSLDATCSSTVRGETPNRPAALTPSGNGRTSVAA